MKFELNQYHQGVTDEELIENLKLVASFFADKYLSIVKYESKGKYSATTFCQHFGSWSNALKVAGLRLEKTSEEKKRISDNDLISDVLQVANMMGKDSITSIEYNEFGKFSSQSLFERFGSWSNIIEKAKLKPTDYVGKIPDEQLFEEIERIWISLGRQPTTTDMKKGISKYGLDSFTRRFGGWRNALITFLNYVDEDTENEQTINTIEYMKNDDFVNEVTETNYNTNIFKHHTPRNINLRLRWKVITRDNFKCCACGASPAKDPSVDLHIDHITPWSKGGETIMDNLQTLCSKCNFGKSDLDNEINADILINT